MSWKQQAARVVINQCLSSATVPARTPSHLKHRDAVSGVVHCRLLHLPAGFPPKPPRCKRQQKCQDDRSHQHQHSEAERQRKQAAVVAPAERLAIRLSVCVCAGWGSELMAVGSGAAWRLVVYNLRGANAQLTCTIALGSRYQVDARPLSPPKQHEQRRQRAAGRAIWCFGPSTRRALYADDPAYSDQTFTSLILVHDRVDLERGRSAGARGSSCLRSRSSSIEVPNYMSDVVQLMYHIAVVRRFGFNMEQAPVKITLAFGSCLTEGGECWQMIGAAWSGPAVGYPSVCWIAAGAGRADVLPL
jgi:hypothetical protein